MAARIPQVKPRQIISVLQQLGFIIRRQTGSHVILRHPSSKRIAVVPDHAQELKRGLLFGILKQADISPEEFLHNL